MKDRKETIKYFFNALNIDNIDEIEEFYADDIHFVDPITDVKGLQAMKDYYAGLYQHVVDISFDFTDIIIEGNQASAAWTMNLQLKKLNGGKPFSVPGISLIKFNDQDKAVFHQDYYDMGEFIYERIGLIGSIIKFIKNKLKH